MDSKLHLPHSKIYNFSSIARRTFTTGTCISCSIDNYSNLQNSVYHCLTRTVSNCEFTFKLFKKKGSHFFQLHCNLTEDMKFYVMYDEHKHSEGVAAKNQEYGYWVEASNDLVLNPGNTNLYRQNSLVVQFHGGHNFYFLRTPFTLSGTRTSRDEEMFSRDMLKLYEWREQTADFPLIVRGEVFKVHKFVFAQRSRWFEEYSTFQEWNQLCIQGEPLLMDRVVRYIYSGVLEETDFDDMLKVLELAETLKMPGLFQTASGALKSTVTAETALKLLKMARKLEILNLMTFAMMMLPDSSPEKRQGRKKRSKRRR